MYPIPKTLGTVTGFCFDKIGKKIWNSTMKTRFKAHLGAKRVSVINEPDTD
jgi:hypothetical protein